MTTTQLPIRRDPEIMSGTPTFVGTRVPAQTLQDYLESSETRDAFPADFPSVSRGQGIAAVDLGNTSLIVEA